MRWKQLKGQTSTNKTSTADSWPSKPKSLKSEATLRSRDEDVILLISDLCDLVLQTVSCLLCFCLWATGLLIGYRYECDCAQPSSQFTLREVLSLISHFKMRPRWLSLSALRGEWNHFWTYLTGEAGKSNVWEKNLIFANLAPKTVFENLSWVSTTQPSSINPQYM